jgi:hypothetical protein
VTVNDILGGHVGLDLECFDRIYLNGYVPNLQVGGQVVNFLTARGHPIPSPASLEKNGTVFQPPPNADVVGVAECTHHGVPSVAADQPAVPPVRGEDLRLSGQVRLVLDG